MDIEILRKYCLSLPGVTEDIKWGADLCFLIGAKMFCVTGLEQPFRMSFKVDPEQYETLILRDGFYPAPYLARAKWVMVDESAVLSDSEWQDLICDSYRLVKDGLPKKVLRELGL